ncbi:AAA domain-containing protein [Vibrio crassostreae]|nr:AAA domain-containing protein [Vibrio crassostreae]CAK2829673.1 AAA domain-containing protein [Vibrio crassostreae]CAK2832036.1 AAA domain-containing protein [Vibrio crassostreae]CAK2860802.1 AAA domain-containing protein [Vibrio crassostreae]CAK2895973.1 AAA domain-containing protein [Vibrio crassostreae]
MISELKLKNVGPIKEAQVPIKDLTIICGRNGVGKTYLSYSYFMLVDSFRQLLLKRVNMADAVRDSIYEMASTREPSRKSFEVKFDDFGLSHESISEALALAGENNEIFSTLGIDNAPETIISGEIDRETYETLFNSKGRISLKGSLDIEVSKEEQSDTIKIVLVKKHDDELDFDSVYGDVEFITSIYVIDYLAKLNQFPITSERTGISLFFEDLLKARRNTEHGSVGFNAYSVPIENNLNNMRMITTRKHAYNNWIHENKKSLQSQVSQMLGGSYKVENNSVFFQPKGKDILVPLRSSSGASKSLMLMDYFMYNYDSYGALIIDEPELNLHLDNQKEIARVLCSIANMGIQVVVTTHSDHFVREINNLIMLSSSKIKEHHKQAIMKKADVHKLSIIKPEQVSTVVLSSKQRKSFVMPVSEYGIDLKLFNDEIMANNDVSSELMMAIYEGSDA